MHELPLMDQCRLDPAELRAQSERYRRLAEQATEVKREGERLTVTFGEDLDTELLKETIGIEQECCSFFVFDYSRTERRLTATVDPSDRLPALDALAYAFGGG
jgi:hypothetical protein